MPKMVKNSFGKKNFMQPMGKPKPLVVPNVFPLCPQNKLKN
jgi:hypothetical protein